MSTDDLIQTIGQKYYSDLSRYYILESKFIGMDNSKSKYIVSVNLLNHTFDTIVDQARFVL